LRSGGNADKMLSSLDITVCSKVVSSETMRSICLGTKISPWGAFSAEDVRSKATINICRCIELLHTFSLIDLYNLIFLQTTTLRFKDLIFEVGRIN